MLLSEKRVRSIIRHILLEWDPGGEGWYDADDYRDPEKNMPDITSKSSLSNIVLKIFRAIILGPIEARVQLQADALNYMYSIPGSNKDIAKNKFKVSL